VYAGLVVRRVCVNNEGRHLGAALIIFQVEVISRLRQSLRTQPSRVRTLA
jgi:hypothetical protein